MSPHTRPTDRTPTACPGCRVVCRRGLRAGNPRPIDGCGKHPRWHEAGTRTPAPLRRSANQRLLSVRNSDGAEDLRRLSVLQEGACRGRRGPSQLPWLQPGRPLCRTCVATGEHRSRLIGPAQRTTAAARPHAGVRPCASTRPQRVAAGAPKASSADRSRSVRRHTSRMSTRRYRPRGCARTPGTSASTAIAMT